MTNSIENSSNKLAEQIQTETDAVTGREIKLKNLEKMIRTNKNLAKLYKEYRKELDVSNQTNNEKEVNCPQITPFAMKTDGNMRQK